MKKRTTSRDYDLRDKRSSRGRIQYSEEEYQRLYYQKEEALRQRKNKQSGKKKKRRKKKKRFPIFKLFIFILLLLLLAGLGALFFAYQTVNQIPKVPNGRIPVSAEFLQHRGSKNYLVIGLDNVEDEEAHRSDTMMIVTIHPNKKEVSMTSLLRDMYVSIPGKGYNRINAAYALGGIDLLEATIAENFGIQIDGSLVVTYDTVKAMVDSVGGIEIELDFDKARHINLAAGREIAYEGQRHLDGETALWYSRIRYLDDDFHRTARQQEVIGQVMKKALQKNIGIIKPFNENVLPTLRTNMKNEEIFQAGFHFLKAGGFKGMKRHQIPVEDSYTFEEIDGMSVIDPDFEANRDYIQNQIMNP